jgi:hypothetical protein
VKTQQQGARRKQTRKDTKTERNAKGKEKKVWNFKEE